MSEATATFYAAASQIVTDPGWGQVNPADPRFDELIPLKEAAAELPRGRRGRKRAIQTLYRWTSRRGCRGIVLRSTQVGCMRCTTRRWLGEFFAALAAQSRGETPMAPSAPAACSSAARREAIERADRELERMGVGV
jgi:hypothetical protein